MLERLFEFFTDPAQLIVIAAGLGSFLTILSFVMPYVRPDPMGRRLQLAARRRRELRDAQLESAPRKSKLRRDRPSRIRELVDRFKLRDMLASPELKIKLLQANWRDPNAVAVFVAARLLAPVGLCALAALYLYGSGKITMAPIIKLVLVSGAVAAGYYLPAILMQNAIQKRQDAFTKSFPDALDLLLICVESGLSAEAAFGRVAQEMGANAQELAEEFELTTAELAYLPDRRAALENLALRTGLASVKAVCTTLIQADKYGTPLSTALKVAAQENRDRRMAAAEKKAHSLPATLTVPMIVFFLPVLFLVILGPIFIQFQK